MIRHVIRLLLVAILISVPPPPAIAAENFIDGTNTAVPFGQSAHRIVSLAPNITEMLWFLGLGNRQVARTDFCNYPKGAEELPTIGGFADTSLEAIIATNPDLVVAYQGNSLELMSQLRQLGIRVVAFKEAVSLSEIGEQMATLYKVAAGPGVAMPKGLRDWQASLKTAGNQEPGARLSVFYGYPGEMTYTCGKGSFMDNLIHLAGGSNVVQMDERWPCVSAEYIAASAPQVILSATSCTGPKCELTVEHEQILEALSSQSPWNSLPAVKDNRLIVVDADILLRPGPRSLDALKQVRQQLAGWSD